MLHLKVFFVLIIFNTVVENMYPNKKILNTVLYKS